MSNSSISNNSGKHKYAFYKRIPRNVMNKALEVSDGLVWFLRLKAYQPLFNP